MQLRTVLCFGDSNTHGTMAMRTVTDRRRLPRSERWPSVMAAALGEGWEVIPEGHPGRTAVLDDPIEGVHKNGLRSLQTLLESHRPIDLFIIMLGTNDLKARFGVSARDISLGLQRAASEVLRSDCGPDDLAPDLLLAAPVRAMETGIFDDVFAGAAAKSAALPAFLFDVADRLEAGFIDLNDVASVDPVDGIHLDASAHAKIGNAMAGAVKKRFGPNNEGG